MSRDELAPSLAPGSASRQIGEYLRRLTEEGGSHNFVIFQVGRCHYVQFAASCGSATMYGEASSGRYCTPGCTCLTTPAQRAHLRRLGWHPPTRTTRLNFYRYWSFISEHDPRTIAETVVATLEIFGWADGVSAKVNLHLDW